MPNWTFLHNSDRARKHAHQKGRDAKQIIQLPTQVHFFDMAPPKSICHMGTPNNKQMGKKLIGPQNGMTSQDESNIMSFPSRS